MSDMEMSELLRIRNKLGAYGDLFMRLNGYYRTGPRDTKEPEFGYRKFGDLPPIQKEAADFMADMAEEYGLEEV